MLDDEQVKRIKEEDAEFEREMERRAGKPEGVQSSVPLYY